MNVTLIRRQGTVAVIQWTADGQLQRSVIPMSELADLGGGQFDCEAPELGAPYGEQWAALISLTATPDAVERALHHYGIWTARDIQKNHLQALAAIQSLYAADLGNLLKAVRTHLRGD